MNVILLSFVIAGAGFAAGVLPFFFQWTHVTAHRWIAFGAGIILGVAFLHMIPQAYEMAGPQSLPIVLLGFLSLYLVEQFTLDHPHDEAKGEFHEIGLLTFAGLVIHDLIDGLALGSGYETPTLTPAIFIALILHKIPMTFSLSLLMMHGGFRRGKILLFVGIVLLAIPLGALLSMGIRPLLGDDPQVSLGRLILFSAGTFLYIGAYELLPEMHRQSGPESRIGLFFTFGLTVMFLLKLIHPVH